MSNIISKIPEPSTNLIYKLNGADDKIKYGLDVFALAPILLAVGELIKESNKTINQHGKDIVVNVKPFKEGSFIIDILLFVGDHHQQIMDLASGDTIKEIKELLETVGLIAGISGINFLQLIKLLKGNPKSVEQIKPNEIKYTGQNGDSHTVNKEVHQLFQNNNIQQIVYNAYGRPLEQESIDSVESYIKSEEKETKQSFKDEDRVNLKNYSEAEIPNLDTEEIMESEMEVFLSPKRGSYDADPRQWSFKMGAGDQIITAYIKDEEFLKKCKSGEIKPHHLDVLHVKLIQKIKKTNEKLELSTVTYEIKKVLDYQIYKPNPQTQIDTD